MMEKEKQELNVLRYKRRDVKKKVKEELKETNKRISELEKMLSKK